MNHRPGWRWWMGRAEVVLATLVVLFVLACWLFGVDVPAEIGGRMLR
jgi:hypothetical protein